MPPRPRKSSASPSPTPGPAGESGSSPASSASATSSPLGFASVAFTKPESPPEPAKTASEINPPAPPPAPPIEWDGEKAGPILQGIGYAFHSLDPLASTPQGAELWKMTEDDLDAIAEPLARIANRYDVARQAAGLSDEISVGVAVWPYFKRNLEHRGRIKAAVKQAETEQAQPLYPTPPPPAPAEPEPSPPAGGLIDLDALEAREREAEGHHPPPGDVFDFPARGVRQPE